MKNLCNKFSSQLTALFICVLRSSFLSYYILELMIYFKTHTLLILPEGDRDVCINRLIDRYSFCLTEAAFYNGIQIFFVWRGYCIHFS